MKSILFIYIYNLGNRFTEIYAPASKVGVGIKIRDGVVLSLYSRA